MNTKPHQGKAKPTPLGLDLFKYIRSILYNLGLVDWNVFKQYYYFYTEYLLNNSIVEGLLSGLNIGIKSSILIFIFI
jgi:hypothetical protein